jgi:hypothetical protein
MPADVRAFFDAYRDAFNRLDGREVSAFYQVPSMISSAVGPGLFTDAESLIANNEKLCEIYRDSGFVRTDYREGGAMPQSTNFFVVDLEWSIHREQQPPQVFNTTYQLVRRDTASAWKIEHIAAYSEKRFWTNHD